MSIIRQDIVDAMLARLQLIATASGYYTNCGLDVKSWRSVPFDRAESAAPAPTEGISVKDVEETIDSEAFKGNYNRLTWRLRLEILILIASSSSTDTVMRQAIADVYKAIGIDDTLGGKCQTIVPISDQVVVQENQVWKIAGAQIDVDVIYQTNRWSES